ncbi:3-hydroxybutyryl-CoA dehydrogenase [Lentibacillus sp. JNUCC-1]|uniref:3-hydroxyacyl-CoA dehydrogenase n=1 Tax=Lentibacillus sp. JNUCC-1 TaxID=2654513 RepID=UPI0012E92948|nr:3-hydroxyacyl-CoA dehydrogenase [Lentibacillus sp. JNUCC-1]MUV37541.1 3-hydroxybutyryl-CoA dehydrogenase [Lentibacillus sp. JNUCC-1]
MTINDITVVGAGVMGRGIAYVSSLGGFRVTLVDVSTAQLSAACDHIERLTEQAVDRGKLTEASAANLLDRLNTSTDLQSAVAETDCVIEAVPEKHDLKQDVLETAGRYAPSKAIFASNTSTISPTELASYTGRPAQFAVMHFFNPVHKMRLVEIVKGLETAEDTVQLIKQAAEKMGKETVEVNEFPGFVTSRISALVGNEAFHMLQEGVASAEDIDKAIKLGLNYPMGPLELGDLVGLDTRLNNLRYLHKTLGDKFRPAPLLEAYVKAGRLGRKSGRGVYDYTDQGRGWRT